MAEKIKLLKDTQHAWTRKYATFIAFPNGDESFTAMLILPKNNERGFASLTNDRQIENFFNETFPNFIPALSEMKQAIIENPKGSFVTVFTNPWYYKDFMAIFGDAAHACLPFYGIGMSVAFGDCMEFVDLLDKHGEDWNEIFSRYQKARKNHTDIIGNLAKESFVRFRRHKKADYVAIYDRFETLLHTILPKVFRPPLFHLVANNPNNTVEFFQKHNQQRKTARFLGIPILVHTLAKAIELKEKLIKKT